MNCNAIENPPLCFLIKIKGTTTQGLIDVLKKKERQTWPMKNFIKKTERPCVVFLSITKGETNERNTTLYLSFDERLCSEIEGVENPLLAFETEENDEEDTWSHYTAVAEAFPFTLIGVSPSKIRDIDVYLTVPLKLKMIHDVHNVIVKEFYEVSDCDKVLVNMYA